MKQAAPEGTQDGVSAGMYTVGKGSGAHELIEMPALPEDVMEGIGQLMAALVRLREAETRLSEASMKFMKLSSQDMRALHYLITAKRQSVIVTPGMLANHLEISPASTTKLLNRLEQGKHIVRHVHPTDRRAFMIEVTQETALSAKQTVGKQQARRFYAAARLTDTEREAVTRFLNDMANELSLSNAEWVDKPDGARRGADSTT